MALEGWFIGAVPNLITGVWTGCEDRSAHFGGYLGTYFGQGATTALPIWALYMRKNYENPELTVSKKPFERPAGDLGIQVDCSAIQSGVSSSQEGGDGWEDEF